MTESQRHTPELGYAPADTRAEDRAMRAGERSPEQKARSSVHHGASAPSSTRYGCSARFTMRCASVIGKMRSNRVGAGPRRNQSSRTASASGPCTSRRAYSTVPASPEIHPIGSQRRRSSLPP